MSVKAEGARARINEILREMTARQARAIPMAWIGLLAATASVGIYWYYQIEFAWWQDTLFLLSMAIVAFFGIGTIGLSMRHRAVRAATRRFVKSFGNDEQNFRRARRALDNPDTPSEVGSQLSRALDLLPKPASLYGGPTTGGDPATYLGHFLKSIEIAAEARRQRLGSAMLAWILAAANLPWFFENGSRVLLTVSLPAAGVIFMTMGVVIHFIENGDVRRAARIILAIHPARAPEYDGVLRRLASLKHKLAPLLLTNLPQYELAYAADRVERGALSVTSPNQTPPQGSTALPADDDGNIQIAGRPASYEAPAATAQSTERAASVTSLLKPSSRQKSRSHDPGFVEAIRVAYRVDIQHIVSVLQEGFSALVCCDKIVVEHLWKEIVERAGLEPVVLEVSDAAKEGGLLQGQLRALKARIESVDAQKVLVVPNLDLLAGGSSYPTEPVREFTELVYRSSSCVILAFSDPSLELPAVVSNRFSIRRVIQGVPKTVEGSDGKPVPVGEALIRPDEIAQIDSFDPDALYPHISGLNPIEIRRVVRYAIRQGNESVGMEALYETIRLFKTKASRNFEVHEIQFSDIGGYDEVKVQLERALLLMEGHFRLPNEKLRQDLIPRGFMLYGPPGTGKTLFAKAIANRLKATVAVVSGPEVLDSYWGGTERKIRELFADARRNAPSVIVFDEFDALAPVRSSHAHPSAQFMSSIVAQILTEMDGFRAGVPMLVIGTTNRLELIDPAFLRPSRFQAIAVGLPNRKARRDIAGIHAQRFAIDVQPHVLDAFAEATANWSGDEIKAVFRDLCAAQVSQESPHSTDYLLGQMVGQMRRRKENRQASAVVEGALSTPSSVEEAGLVPLVVRRQTASIQPIDQARMRRH